MNFLQQTIFSGVITSIFAIMLWLFKRYFDKQTSENKEQTKILTLKFDETNKTLMSIHTDLQNFKLAVIKDETKPLEIRIAQNEAKVIELEKRMDADRFDRRKN